MRNLLITMSRVGSNPITIKEGVTVQINGQDVTVKGSKGEILLNLPWKIEAKIEENILTLAAKDIEKETKSLHGTYRMLISNAIHGVSEEFNKNLELVGVGFRARMEGTSLVMDLGLNHVIKFDAPEGITIEVPEETKIVVKGVDKQKVGEFAAKIREIKKPEPYKGKGIRYEGEYVRKKSAKSGASDK